jgi:DNA-binding NarL/FixJ family response regulator
LDRRSSSLPRWIGAHSEKLLAARGDPERLMEVFRRTVVPMVMLDDERRYVEANSAAQSALAVSLDELRRLRLDDVTPPYLGTLMEANWARMIETGSIMSHEVARPSNYLGVTYYAMADVLPGRHAIAFSPAGIVDGDELLNHDDADPPAVHLTRREREVLELAAGGLNGPGIAEELVLSSATVRTHFGHIYRKLEAGDRAAAVAKAMRLGLIR